MEDSKQTSNTGHNNRTSLPANADLVNERAHLNFPRRVESRSSVSRSTGSTFALPTSLSFHNNSEWMTHLIQPSFGHNSQPRPELRIWSSDSSNTHTARLLRRHPIPNEFNEYEWGNSNAHIDPVSETEQNPDSSQEHSMPVKSESEFAYAATDGLNDQASPVSPTWGYSSDNREALSQSSRAIADTIRLTALYSDSYQKIQS
ncbi:hypothetical protein GYMLUDRAFT_1004671 [Collybiopsis luxurians FD-317 M1]|uniref:Uncharacterized protein n=1 Tax=Collybiopsis luxurians FD-317 M1 TaxID=944289 RepID=A0A0D0B737_9AGAR|nr:hypothetical protein GYMLUDRAFT_1004671 [Collybiopsis luxurians FD-317 M1]